MIDFKNPPKERIISEIPQEIKVGDLVRCYENNSDNMEGFVGYAYVTQILSGMDNYCWCEASVNDFENGKEINFAYFVIKTHYDNTSNP